MANEIETMATALQNMLMRSGLNHRGGARLVIVAPDERAVIDIMMDIRRQSASYASPLAYERDAVTVNGVTVMVRSPRKTVEV